MNIPRPLIGIAAVALSIAAFSQAVAAQPKSRQ